MCFNNDQAQRAAELLLVAIPSYRHFIVPPLWLFLLLYANMCVFVCGGGHGRFFFFKFQQVHVLLLYLEMFFFQNSEQRKKQTQ